RFGDPGGLQFRNESAPAHGSIDVAPGSWGQSPSVTYTPDPGFQGVDSFTYSTRDATSEFPRSPAIATFRLHAGTPPVPTVPIGGAPAAMSAGTSVQLHASVTNDPPDVAWSVDGTVGGEQTHGTISADGLYRAPASPPGERIVTIAARSADGGHDERSIRI